MLFQVELGVFEEVHLLGVDHIPLLSSQRVAQQVRVGVLKRQLESGAELLFEWVFQSLNDINLSLKRLARPNSIVIRQVALLLSVKLNWVLIRCILVEVSRDLVHTYLLHAPDVRVLSDLLRVGNQRPLFVFLLDRKALLGLPLRLGHFFVLWVDAEVHVEVV